MNNKEKRRVPNLRTDNKQKLRLEVEKVNNLLEKINSPDITTTNNLIYAGAVVVTERLGVKWKQSKNPKEPAWKNRLEKQIKLLRKDLARTELLSAGKKLKKKYVRRRIAKKILVEQKRM